MDRSTAEVRLPGDIPVQEGARSQPRGTGIEMACTNPTSAQVSAVERTALEGLEEPEIYSIVFRSILLAFPGAVETASSDHSAT